MKHNKLSFLLTVSLAGLLSGCAGNSGMTFDFGAEGAAEIQPRQGLKALSNTRPCCSSLAELAYLPINKTGKVDFLIDESAEVFAFSTGKSFVQGVALPKADGNINLALSSPILSSVYVPSLLLLDETFKPVRLYGKKHIHYQKAGLFSGERYYGEFEIKPQDNARYLVLFSTQEAMSGQTQLAPVDPKALEAGVAKAARRTFLDEPVPHSAVGAVRLVFSYLPDSSEQSTGLLTTDTEREAESLVAKSQKSELDVISTSPASADELQPETEAMFVTLIKQAVQRGDLNKAMKIVNDAEKAGFSSAREALINSLK